MSQHTTTSIYNRTRANKTNAGNGSKAICRVSNVLCSPSPDPRRYAKNFSSMSNPTANLGYIHEYYPFRQSNRDFFREANDTALEELPSDDSFPPLCRSMVSTTGIDWEHGSHGGQRLIIVGGYFNHILDHLPQWLDKFEGLLKRLYWTQAEVRINGGWMCASYSLRYQITQDVANQYVTEPNNPHRDWSFSVFDVREEPSHDDRLDGFLGSTRFHSIVQDSDVGSAKANEA